MELKKIKEVLNKAGYKALLRDKNQTDIGEHIIGGNNDDSSNFKINAVFRIWIVDDQIILDFMSQVTENKKFGNYNDLMEFIIRKFPIE